MAKYKQTADPDFQQSEEKQDGDYLLVFRENRKFELTLKVPIVEYDGEGRELSRIEVLFFGPHGSLAVPKSVVDSMTDFEKSFFNVEVL